MSEASHKSAPTTVIQPACNPSHLTAQLRLVMTPVLKSTSIEEDISEVTERKTGTHEVAGRVGLLAQLAKASTRVGCHLWEILAVDDELFVVMPFQDSHDVLVVCLCPLPTKLGDIVFRICPNR